MFERILVPLDGSLLAEGVLPPAAAIARAFNSDLLVLQLTETQPRAGTRPQLFDTLSLQIHKVQAQLYLQGICDRLTKEGLRAEWRVLEGRAAEGIVVFAENEDMQLVVLSSHGRRGISYWGISSITQKVIVAAPTSMLLVRAHEAARDKQSEAVYRRILVPLDGSQRAEHVLPVIQRLARAQGSEVNLAHVVRAPEMARQLPPLPEDIELSERIVNRNHDEAERYLMQLAKGSGFEGINVQTRLITSDNTAAALHHLVEEQHSDLLVMSAHGYSGKPEWPYGSMVHNFISYGGADLLIVQDLPAKHDLSAAAMAARERAER
jgi:nucleotide-binding universal stress UspA family protein